MLQHKSMPTALTTRLRKFFPFSFIFALPAGWKNFPTLRKDKTVYFCRQPEYILTRQSSHFFGWVQLDNDEYKRIRKRTANIET